MKYKCNTNDSANQFASEVNKVLFGNSDAKSSDIERLPSELLILSRFCVRYPFLRAVWRISKKFDAPIYRIIKATGAIPEVLWLEAQELLAQELARKRRDHRVRTTLMYKAVTFLKDEKPEYSAYRCMTLPQKICFSACLSGVAYSFYMQPTLTAHTISIALGALYATNVLIRDYLLWRLDDATKAISQNSRIDNSKLPVYTILVALHEESGEISDLTGQLLKLDWPKNKLDIKLICEADDLQTIAAIADTKLPPQFETVLVPPSKPRTKPRALNYTLSMAHGTYTVLYDAEDRPAPGQLREAYSKFLSSDANVACLQAPLRIHNSSQTWLTKMFAIEYLTLFNGILPVLAMWRVPFPFGGTSNHFKTDILKQMGGWDPYDVTEDADLGIRLYREGYRCETITTPTYEEAPPNFRPWIKQRTRWIKGWMQTLLVHNRNPVLFIRQVGWKNALSFHLFLTPTLLSALIYPFFLFAIIFQVSFQPGLPFPWNTIFWGVITFNFVGGYTTHGMLAYKVINDCGNSNLASHLALLVIYWVFISIASWRALYHLIVKPHSWEKHHTGWQTGILAILLSKYTFYR